MSQGKVTITIMATLAVLAVGCGRAASTSASPGLEPYTPTKLEWLQVEAQTELAENAPCYTVNLTKRGPDTMVVVVAYKRCMTEEGARVVTVQDVEAVRMMARAHGWDGWVKIEKDVHLLNGDGRE
jgi:hypothetical protein